LLLALILRREGRLFPPAIVSRFCLRHSPLREKYLGFKDSEDG
jgi:hypothetical protein